MFNSGNHNRIAVIQAQALARGGAAVHEEEPE